METDHCISQRYRLVQQMIRIYIFQVASFKPDGTDDALHFYINGIEMNINVIVNSPQAQTKSKSILKFTCIHYEEVCCTNLYCDTCITVMNSDKI